MPRILPTFQNAGAGASNAATTAFNVAYPTGITVDDLLLLQFQVRDTANAPTTPSGWSILFGPDSNTVSRQWIYSKIADGTETGNLSVQVATGAVTHMARIYRFSNVKKTSFSEGGAHGSNAASTTVSANSLTTNNDNELGLAFIYIGNDDATVSFTGETGGDWTELVAEFTTTNGNDGAIQAQSVTMSTAGTVSGGSYTIGIADPWGNRSFALIGPGYNVAQANADIKTTNFLLGQAQAQIRGTKFYFTSTSSQPSFAPAYDAEWDKTSESVRHTLETIKTGTPLTNLTASENVTTTPYDVAVGQFISAPLNGAQTIQGPVRGIIQVVESTAAADFQPQIIIRVIASDASTIRGTLIAADTTGLSNEFPATQANRKFPKGWTGNGTASTPVSAQDGDRIVIEVGFRSLNAVATNRTANFRFGDPLLGSVVEVDALENETDTAGAIAWIELSGIYQFKAIEDRATQDTTQVLMLPNDAVLRVTQDTTQVLMLPNDAALRVTQDVIQVLWAADAGPTTNYLFAQAQADIKQTGYLFAQGQADIKSVGFLLAQAQASIIKTGYLLGQGQADIKATGFLFAQAQADIKKLGFSLAQAQADIKAVGYLFGQSNADIKQTGFLFAQAQARITGKPYLLGQAQADIKALGFLFAQANADIKKTGFLCAQAQANIGSTNRVFAQAQADIKATGYLLAQAQADIKTRGFLWAQCQADIKHIGFLLGQCQATIVRTAYLLAQSQADIKASGYLSGQSQADIKHSGALFGQAQAFIQPYFPALYGQATAFIHVETILPPGEFFTAPKYKVQYNGYILPGYAQQEGTNSTGLLGDHQAPYADMSLTDSLGLENKTYGIRMKIWTTDFDAARVQVQRAATYLRSNREEFVPLYVQYANRHYSAITKSVHTQKEVGTSLKLRDYDVEFELKPWLYGETVHTLAGTGIVTTDLVGRTLDNGTWTPLTMVISGTNVTISGYTDTQFAGYLSTTGTVTNLRIDSENYTAVFSGGSVVNALDSMTWADFAIYAGPGKTTYEITGATSCELSYLDRWLI